MMNEYAPFEYCEIFQSGHVLRPKVSFADDSVEVPIDMMYSRHFQAPTGDVTIQLEFPNPVANYVKGRVNIEVMEAFSANVEIIDDYSLTVEFIATPYDGYRESAMTLGNLKYPGDHLSDLAGVKIKDVLENGLESPSEFERTVFDENDILTREFFKAPRITSVTSEVVGGIRRAVSLSGSVSTQKLGILSIVGRDLGNYSAADLLQLVPRSVRIEMRREADNPSNAITITPLPDDIITWTDQLIEFYVPTFGYLDFDRAALSIGHSGAFSGKVLVINQAGQDSRTYA